MRVRVWGPGQSEHGTDYTDFKAGLSGCGYTKADEVPQGERQKCRDKLNTGTDVEIREHTFRRVP